MPSDAPSPSALPTEAATLSNGSENKPLSDSPPSRGVSKDGDTAESSIHLATTPNNTTTSTPSPLEKPTQSADDEDVEELTRDVDRTTITDAMSSDIWAALTEAEKEVVQDLKGIQDNHKKLRMKYEVEWNALKAKYEKLYNPLYEMRSERLSRIPEGAAEDITKSNGTPALIGFWLKSFKNNGLLREMIEPQDEEILAYLVDIKSEWMDDTKQDGFRLTFKFRENPFFDEPTTLVKEYNMSTQEGEDEPILNSFKCTKIEWKEGKDVTKKVITRKQRNKRTKVTRTVTEVVENASFFTFFKDHEIPTEAQLDKMKPQEVQELELVVENDYEAGVIIRDKIIPEAVLWYLGEVDDDDDFEGDDEDDSGFEDDDDDDDNDDDDDDSDDGRRVGAASKVKGKGKGRGKSEVPGKGNGEQPECKTQ